MSFYPCVTSILRLLPALSVCRPAGSVVCGRARARSCTRRATPTMGNGTATRRRFVPQPPSCTVCPLCLAPQRHLSFSLSCPQSASVYAPDCSLASHEDFLVSTPIQNSFTLALALITSPHLFICLSFCLSLSVCLFVCLCSLMHTSSHRRARVACGGSPCSRSTRASGSPTCPTGRACTRGIK